MRSANTLTKAISIAALALALVASAVPSSKAGALQETEQQLVWESFMREYRPGGNDFDRYRLSDRDVITVNVSNNFSNPSSRDLVSWATRDYAHPVPYDKVEIVLVSGRNVTWWKGITAFKNAPLRRPGAPRENWVRLEHLATQDDEHGPKSMLLTAVDLRDGLMLSFEKAKAFGAHTPMYSFKVPNLNNLGGHRITFTWAIDG